MKRRVLNLGPQTERVRIADGAVLKDAMTESVAIVLATPLRRAHWSPERSGEASNVCGEASREDALEPLP